MKALLSVLACLLGMNSLNCALAQTPTHSAPPAAAAVDAAPGAAKRDTYPFRGRIAAIDSSARTLTLAGAEKQRVIQLTADTKLTKDGKTATLDAAVVGDEVAGLLRQAASGSPTAVSVRIGAKPAAAPKSGKGRQNDPGAE